MRTARIIRITLLMAAIFVAGLFTGRWSTPPPPAPAAAPSEDQESRIADLAVRMLSRQVSLDAQQQESMRTIIEEIATEMEIHPHGSRERLEVFHRSVPRMRAALHPDQYAAFDGYVQATTRRFERKIRRDNSR